MQHDGGLPRGQVAHLTVAPGHGHAQTQADGFAEGLFGAEAGSQVTYTAFWPTGAARAPGLEFGLGQYFLSKAFAMSIQAARIRRTSQISVPTP